jgi:hypothetical protein
MNTSHVNLERPARARPPEAKAAVRALSLYVVPHVAEDRGAAIAKTAYLNAARRGFAPGHELEDWLAAENEVDQRLAGEGRAF